ncbi:serine/threonine protein kinase [Fonticula alba]|uniref:Serine/threonine protein kinase n=1 Tax=Fonticula alba TaxID=691883 RepID=A0A058ZHR3_FONAL|nr:serine/threonine protein kinase [Fonticula alba]KCV73463.1 serine/threonine protein kinase [Fonticula alba]|eukprot:XP_009493164.1 serine/threonine protein kinase [Fonticula alba]
MVRAAPPAHGDAIRHRGAQYHRVLLLLGLVLGLLATAASATVRLPAHRHLARTLGRLFDEQDGVRGLAAELPVTRDPTPLDLYRAPAMVSLTQGYVSYWDVCDEAGRPGADGVPDLVLASGEWIEVYCVRGLAAEGDVRTPPLPGGGSVPTVPHFFGPLGGGLSGPSAALTGPAICRVHGGAVWCFVMENGRMYLAEWNAQPGVLPGEPSRLRRINTISIGNSVPGVVPWMPSAFNIGSESGLFMLSFSAMSNFFSLNFDPVADRADTSMTTPFSSVVSMVPTTNPEQLLLTGADGVYDAFLPSYANRSVKMLARLPAGDEAFGTAVEVDMPPGLGRVFVLPVVNRFSILHQPAGSAAPGTEITSRAYSDILSNAELNDLYGNSNDFEMVSIPRPELGCTDILCTFRVQLGDLRRATYSLGCLGHGDLRLRADVTPGLLMQTLDHRGLNVAAFASPGDRRWMLTDMSPLLSRSQLGCDGPDYSITCGPVLSAGLSVKGFEVACAPGSGPGLNGLPSGGLFCPGCASGFTPSSDMAADRAACISCSASAECHMCRADRPDICLLCAQSDGRLGLDGQCADSCAVSSDIGPSAGSPCATESPAEPVPGAPVWPPAAGDPFLPLALIPSPVGFRSADGLPSAALGHSGEYYLGVGAAGLAGLHLAHPPSGRAPGSPAPLPSSLDWQTGLNAIFGLVGTGGAAAAALKLAHFLPAPGRTDVWHLVACPSAAAASPLLATIDCSSDVNACAVTGGLQPWELVYPVLPAGVGCEALVACGHPTTGPSSERAPSDVLIVTRDSSLSTDDFEVWSLLSILAGAPVRHPSVTPNPACTGVFAGLPMPGLLHAVREPAAPDGLGLVLQGAVQNAPDVSMAMAMAIDRSMLLSGGGAMASAKKVILLADNHHRTGRPPVASARAATHMVLGTLAAGGSGTSLLVEVAHPTNMHRPGAQVALNAPQALGLLPAGDALPVGAMVLDLTSDQVGDLLVVTERGVALAAGLPMTGGFGQVRWLMRSEPGVSGAEVALAADTRVYGALPLQAPGRLVPHALAVPTSAGLALVSLAVVDRCADGSYLEAGACRACHDVCSTCTGPTAVDCVDCPLRNARGECVPGCRRDCLSCQITPGGNAMCVACPVGYVPDGAHGCARCTLGCDSCSGPAADECLGPCRDGLVLSNGRCLVSCPPGTGALNGECQTCPRGGSGGCTACAQSTETTLSCTVCHEDHYVDPLTGACQWCNPACASCIGPAVDECTACPATAADGAELWLHATGPAGECLRVCPAGFAADVASKSCLPCHESCEACTGTAVAGGPALDSSRCTACPGDRYAEKVVLTPEEPDGPAYVQCHACDDSCAGCTGPGPSDCSACAVGFRMVQNAGRTYCEATCSRGFFEAPSGDCLECHPSCGACVGGADASNCTECAAGLAFELDICPGGGAGTSPTRLCPEARCVSADCPVGQFLASDGVSCAACDASCRACSGPGADQCLDCMDPGVVIENAHCPGTVCAEGFFPSADYTCQKCFHQCRSCSGPRSTECTACIDGLLLFAGRCMDRCPARFFASAAGVCEPCSEGCLVCSGPEGHHCMQCERNLFMVPGGLVEDHAGGCDGTCPARTINIGGQCAGCHASCDQCIGPKPNQCLTCRAPEALLQGGDAMCVDTCSVGFFPPPVSAAGTCSPCSPYCLECSGPGAKQCTACSGASGLLADGLCRAACPSGWFKVAGLDVCEPCSAKCRTCSGPGDNACTGCQADQVLSEPGIGSCLDGCPVGRFFRLEDRSCVACDVSCAKCFGPGSSRCSECSAGMVVSDGRCVDSCPAGTFLDGGLCRKCDHSCGSCRGAEFSQCTSCLEGRLLHEGMCRTECPAGFSADAGARICEACPEHCEVCSGEGASRQCALCTAGALRLGTGCVFGQCPGGFGTNDGQTCLPCDTFDLDDPTNLPPSGCQVPSKGQSKGLALGLALGLSLALLLVVLLVILWVLYRRRQKHLDGKESLAMEALDVDQTILNTTIALSLPGHLAFDFADIARLVDHHDGGAIASGGQGKVQIIELTDPDLIQLHGSSDAAAKFFTQDGHQPAHGSIFEHEIAIMFSLAHLPSVVQLIGYSISPPAIFMRKYEIDLGGLLSSEMELTAADGQHLLADLSSGLEAIHAAGYAHRDIKPGNVFISLANGSNLPSPSGGRWHVVFGDFGAALNITNPSVLKELEFNALSRMFAAPELVHAFNQQLRLPVEGHFACDVYAFAVLAWCVMARSRKPSIDPSTSRPPLAGELFGSWNWPEDDLERFIGAISQAWAEDPGARPAAPDLARAFAMP